MKTGEIIDRLRKKIRLKHYSMATEKSYVGWARRYVFFHADVRTTQIYTHVTGHGAGVLSPLDRVA